MYPAGRLFLALVFCMVGGLLVTTSVALSLVFSGLAFLTLAWGFWSMWKDNYG